MTSSVVDRFSAAPLVSSIVIGLRFLFTEIDLGDPRQAAQPQKFIQILGRNPSIPKFLNPQITFFPHSAFPLPNSN